MTLSRPQRILWTVFRWILAVVPVVWIFSRIDVARLAGTVQHVAWWTIPVLSIILLVYMALQGGRWWMLLRAYLPALSLKRVMLSHFAALYYSIVLPTSGAQDVVRALYIAKDNDYGVVWGASVVSRLLGALVLVAMALLGLLLLARDVVPHLRLYAVISIAVIGVTTWAAFSKRVTRPLQPMAARLLPAKFLKMVENIRDGIYHYRSKKKVLAQVFAVTLVTQFLMLLNPALLAFGITGTFRFVEFLAFIPVIEMICIALPITPGGVGVRESLLAVMFHMIGIGKEELGVYIALSYIGIVLKLVGVFALPFLKKGPTQQPLTAGQK